MGDAVTEKIREILDSYNALCGRDIVPNIREYLLIRKEAIRELGKNPIYPSETVRKINNASFDESKPISINKPAETGERSQDGRIMKMDNYTPSSQPSASLRRETTKGGIKTDFEILQSIKDPWN